MTQSNITHLFEGAAVLVPNAPVACVVDLLRDYLARAERGEITAIAIAAVTPSRNLSTQWAEPGGFRNEVAASVLMLHVRVGCALNGDE